MNKYRGAGLIRAGFIGAVLIVLVIAVGLNPDQLVQRATTVRYQALFSDAGGLATGNDVTISGIKVGSVTGMSLQNGDVLVTFTVKGNVLLGSASTAHIRTGSLLGQRVLTVDSAGSGTMRPLSVIPASRTSSPYSLSEAVGDLATDVGGTDTEALNHSLDTLSTTLNQISPQLGPAFDGITRLSQALNARNQTLGQLLKGAADVTGILSQRSAQLNTLILNANDLVGMLVQRRQAIVRLLASTSAVAKQLKGVVHDNEAKLAPSLEKLNSVTAMLEKNRDNIAKALPGLAKYELTQGETVSSGYYYNPFIPNLFQMEFFQWLFDYAFGFRAYGAPGQPPDTAGPRAFFPWPFNMDPGGRP
ncbi:mammalian cell entry protein [Mycobacterium alsense]|uniref:MCE family protein n=1 Tax=Mycobacterium alsense TaxID=324058 RepID=A0A1A3DGS5_9MYCO|nr:MCE family protein [Mycobacterium alsense]MCV7377759.1 MCE family protein [Mycobacterium alsense]OBG41318.1 mammalian cell entry protein [Mycobacterium alsense]OBI98123.1 mammalian cell entry protein [Mycobacterium alsense]OQZ93113.1 MCE family protein [Mycobacterium alsense]